MKTTIPLLALTLLLAGCGNKQTAANDDEPEYIAEGFAFQAEADGPWGIMDTEGNVIIEPQFDDNASALVNGVFTAANSDGTYTLYAVEGHKTRKIGTYSDTGAFIGDLCPVIDTDLQAKYIDKQGRTVIDLSDVDERQAISVSNFSEGLAVVQLEDNTYGYIDEQGRTAIPFRYSGAWNFSEGIGIVNMKVPEDEEQSRWAAIDKRGNELFSYQFKEMSPMDYMFHEGYLVANDANDRYYLLDKKGQVAHSFEEGVAPYSQTINGLLLAYDRSTQKNGLISVDGDWVLEPNYTFIRYNGKLLAASTDDKHYTLYSLEGEPLKELPKGFPVMLDWQFSNYDDIFFLHNYRVSCVPYDGDGNRLEDKDTFYDFNWSYSPGAYIDVFTGDDDAEEECEDGDW